MSLSRRRFALCSAGLLSGIAGCAGFRSDDSERDRPLEEVHLDLKNYTDDTHTFHFVLEATDGLGEWHDFTVDPGGDEVVDREVAVEPDPDREWIRTHVITGQRRASNRIRRIHGKERTCMHRRYRLEEDQLTALGGGTGKC